jgi:ABC-type glycerol-3-phosphate transport system permease component
MSYVVVGIIWAWIYNYDWGAVNVALRALGLDSWTRAWLGKQETALPALIFITTWMWTGFNMVVLLAALHSLPSEVIEAGRARQLRLGRQALLRHPADDPATVLNLIVLSFVGKMKIFDLVWITTKGGPLWSTETGLDLRLQAGLRVEHLRPRLSLGGRLGVVRDRARLGAGADPRVPAAREAGVLSGADQAQAAARAARPLGLHGVRGRAVLLGRDDVAAHHQRDQPRPLRLAGDAALEQVPDAWFNSNYSTYFQNSLLVVVSAVIILTLVGAMAAHCFARYRFKLNRFFYFIIFSTIIFPPQITIIALFQILVQYGLFNSLIGLTLVYVAFQLPITVYILESFFARIPGRPVRGGAHRRLLGDGDLLAHLAADRAAGAVDDDHPQHDPAVERIPLCGRPHHRRRQADLAARHPALHGRPDGRHRHDFHRTDDRDHPGRPDLRVLLREADPGHDRRSGQVIGGCGLNRMFC